MRAAACLECPHVREALGHKVSRERVGTELDGMFNGPSPSAAARLLHQLRLFPEVFTLPPGVLALVGEEYGGPCEACLEAAVSIMNVQEQPLDKDERRALLLSALLLPLRQLKYSVKGKEWPVSSFVVRDSLKWRGKDVDAVVALHEGAEVLADLATRIAEGSPSDAPEALRVELGHAIRKLKAYWRLGAMLVPLVQQLPEARPLGVEAGAGAAAAAATTSGGSGGQSGASADVGAWLAVVAQLHAAAHAFEVHDSWQWKPLLDGKQAMKAIGMKQGGPQLGQLLAAAMDWQLAHPHGTTEECQAYLVANYSHLASGGTAKQ